MAFKIPKELVMEDVQYKRDVRGQIAILVIRVMLHSRSRVLVLVIQALSRYLWRIYPKSTTRFLCSFVDGSFTDEISRSRTKEVTQAKRKWKVSVMDESNIQVKWLT